MGSDQGQTLRTFSAKKSTPIFKIRMGVDQSQFIIKR